MRIFFSFICFLFLLSPALVNAQEKEPVVISTKDSTPVIKKTIASSNRYDSAMKAHSPKKAALRSAILPGWGQVYNKKYWKVPIVYGALGVCGGVFFYNMGNYKDTRFAYRVKYNMRVNGTDSALFSQIKPKLKPLDEESLRFYRNQFRRDIDYSALFFLLLWGLNVIDATVDAHLKSFDVSPELSLRIKPGYSDMARTNGLSLVMKIGK
ncbi:MAG: hypothetical protein IPQ25_14960 [Chitinophagaceae bacterium]|nr:hypothetical protein [Chitinophagaceae bacterium]